MVHWRAGFLTVAALMLYGATARSQDCVGEMREAAKSWGMHRIAVIQAAEGDVQGAKRTLSQIDEDGPRYPAEVTVVRFCNRMPIYEQVPPIEGNGVWQSFSALDRPGNYIPAQVPPGLPSNYLAADPRHGDVVDFTDEYDARGTRVTSRTYADGSVMIETPHAPLTR